MSDVKISSPDKLLFPKAGITKKGFYLKAVQDHYPDFVHRATVPKRGGEITPRAGCLGPDRSVTPAKVAAQLLAGHVARVASIPPLVDEARVEQPSEVVARGGR